MISDSLLSVSLKSHAMSTELELPSPAKINLWLRVLRRRRDGYHDVETRLCRISLADRVSVERLEDPAMRELTCSDPEIPVGGGNLVWKALVAFEEARGPCHGWRIHLEKRIPSGAGLGGGSSNAAAALRAFNELTGRPLSEKRLMKVASRLGADVPCFLMPSPVADGTGRGEVVAPASMESELPLVLIKPPFPVSTPWAYGNWRDSKEREGVFYGEQLTPWGGMVNHLERPVYEKFLLLPTIKSWLLAQPETRAALMSGSGATIFAVAGSSSDAGELAERARQQFGETLWVETAKTLA